MSGQLHHKSEDLGGGDIPPNERKKTSLNERCLANSPLFSVSLLLESIKLQLGLNQYWAHLFMVHRGSNQIMWESYGAGISSGEIPGK